MKRNRLKYHSLLAPQDWMPPANFKGSKRSWLILLAQNQIVVYFSFSDFFSTKGNIRSWTLIAEEQLLREGPFVLLPVMCQFSDMEKLLRSSCQSLHKGCDSAPVCSVPSAHTQIT